MEKKVISDNELDRVAGGTGTGGVIASGSFSSNSGTQLNIQLNWSVQRDMYGKKVLFVDVFATSYSLYTNGGGVELSVNGMSYWANSASISYGGNTPVSNRLASFNVANVSGSVNLSAVWHFNGVYSGVSLGDIRAGGVISV